MCPNSCKNCAAAKSCTVFLWFASERSGFRVGVKAPVLIDLKEFFLQGRFDCIKPGQKKDWIFSNFLAPGSGWESGHGFSIWQYGAFELHFEKDELFLIWCDKLGELGSFAGLELEKWFLDVAPEPTLPFVTQILPRFGQRCAQNSKKRRDIVVRKRLREQFAGRIPHDRLRA